MRQYYADGSYRRGYRNRLDNYIERIAEFSQPEMVSGRLYSRSYMNDLDLLRDGQLLALMLAAPEKWNPCKEIKGIIEDWATRENEKLREFLQMISEWKKRLHHASFMELAKSYNCMKSNFEKKMEFEAARLNLVQVIDDLLKIASEANQEALNRAPISQTRLIEIGKWASNEAFDKESAAFPLPLFDNIMYTDDQLNKQKLVIRGMKKGEFTDPQMADRALNEKAWFGKTMRDHVAFNILQQILKELEPENLETDSQEAYWTQLKKYAKDALANGLSPILMVENIKEPRGVWDTVPSNLMLRRSGSPKIDGYLWNYADIIATTEYIKGQPGLIDLTLTWEMNTSVRKYPSFRLSYNKRSKSV